ncbi:MAG: DMT family transporter [Synechococcales cyanobacterium K44_A2020_017]|uniref:DMT family transporter n=1 Tax=Leptolyngbya sp. CCY15150 TaxID=2767772 RepID=UPI00194E07BA|nr:DMT family transporter [Leptolyngbya sp. CCY15150]MBF2087866.1 DMT family transporter [Synechococcales cyanobacterium K32_A2020_035]MBF2093671.1 DMT family transporter [Synechococcales cyanobacterium K44_A2020_017]
MFTPLIGELAALTAALIWAVASSIYASLGKQVSPLALNLSKGLIAITLVGLTLVGRGTWPNVPGWAIALLLLSGGIGIGLGDTAFFTSLNCLGARRGLLLESLAPPMAALIALMVLQEYLPLAAWLGIMLTVGGVSWVVVERTPSTPQFQARPRRGILFGFLAALSQASGAVLSRAALSGSEIDPLWSTFLRLVGALLVLVILVAMRQQQGEVVALGRSRRLALTVAVTAFFGTYLAIWLQQVALKFTAAGIAQALGATSPLFVIPIAVWMGDRVSPRALLGMVVALGGVWLLLAAR